MPTEAKQATVAELRDELSNSKAAIVADYRGLTVSDISAVRRTLRGEGISYRVVKNRLAKIAATEAGRGELNELLDGPTALALGKGDEVLLAKTFLDAIRPYRSVVVRGALLGDRRIDADSVTRLATLPPRDVLLAQLAGGIVSPLATLASLFAAPLRNLGYALSQVADQKGQAAGSATTDEPKAEVAAEAPAAEAPVAEATAAETDAPAEPTAAGTDAPAEVEAPGEPEAAAAEEPAVAEATAETEAEAEAPAAEPESGPDADNDQSETEPETA